jgi:glucose/arabinose dehydrogenase
MVSEARKNKGRQIIIVLLYVCALMPYLSRNVILTVFVILLVMIAGCASTTKNGLPAGPSPAETGSVAVPTGGSQTDLTNQNAPYAAMFRAGASSTVLAGDQPKLGLERISGDLSSPMMIATPGDGTGRKFVVDQIGLVRIITADGKLIGEPFLDLRDRMVRLSTGYDERGLLSLAFHPDFKNNSRLFVFYSAPLRAGAPVGWSCTNRLSEFRIIPGNADAVDMNSEKILLMIDKPQSNHNGGPILFGPDDGYLYLALGDGGGSDDTGAGHTRSTGNAQDMRTMLGKILRIDVNTPGTGGTPYSVPQDNPFVATAGILPEIYASGLRNPAYMSFDSGAGHHLTTAVAGQRLFESVFIVTRGGNYGWNIREGTHCFDPANNADPAPACPVIGSRGEPLIGPIVELGHDVGTTIIGGFIYRGSALPALNGTYIYGDWSKAFGGSGDGTILVSSPPAGYDISQYPSELNAITPPDNRMWSTQEVSITTSTNGRVNAFVRGFWEDADHEIYVLTSRNAGPDPAAKSGEIWKLVPG